MKSQIGSGMKHLSNIMTKLPWWAYLIPAALIHSMHTNSAVANLILSTSGNFLAFAAGIFYVLQNNPYTNEEILEQLASLRESQEAYDQAIIALEEERRKFEVFRDRLN
jgi:hypothetical protein